MTAAPDAHRCHGRVALLAADWGKGPRKRAVYSAEWHDGWQIAHLSYRDGWTVAALLDVAHGIRACSDRAVLTGIDVSLGIPVALARRTGAPRLPATQISQSRANAIS